MENGNLVNITLICFHEALTVRTERILHCFRGPLGLTARHSFNEEALILDGSLKMDVPLFRVLLAQMFCST